LARRFKLLALVARQIYPEIATVQGVGTVYISEMERDIPQGVRWRKEVANSENNDSFVLNLEVVSSSK